MKNRKRAMRRHHRERLLNKRKDYWSFGYLSLNTPCQCSCWMCGNPRRRHKQITKAEHIADIDFAEQCEDVGYHITKARKFRDYF